MGSAFSHHSSGDASKPSTRCAAKIYKLPAFTSRRGDLMPRRSRGREPRGRGSLFVPGGPLIVRFAVSLTSSFSSSSSSQLSLSLSLDSQTAAAPPTTPTPTASPTSTAPSSSSRRSAGSSKGPRRGRRDSSSASARLPPPPSPLLLPPPRLRAGERSRWRPCGGRSSTRRGWRRSTPTC